jgi:hypothetical protein
MRSRELLPAGATSWGRKELFVKKRLMIGVLAGGLMAAMLPGVASAAEGQPAGQSASECHLLTDAVPAQNPPYSVSGEYNVGNPAEVLIASDCDGSPIVPIVDDGILLETSGPNGWSETGDFPHYDRCGGINTGGPAIDVTDLFQSGTHTVTLTLTNDCGTTVMTDGPLYLIVNQHAD